MGRMQGQEEKTRAHAMFATVVSGVDVPVSQNIGDAGRGTINVGQMLTFSFMQMRQRHEFVVFGLASWPIPRGTIQAGVQSLPENLPASD